jgi:aspartyl-tRNA(Asn)/glutamyl-tRNA(Gln) amidotransferase subunit C
MPINVDSVTKIAGLAKLGFSETEMERFTTQFQQILDYFQQLETVPTGDIEPTYHALQVEAMETPLREDEEGKSLPAERALANAPATLDNQFRVPKVIE